VSLPVLLAASVGPVGAECKWGVPIRVPAVPGEPYTPQPVLGSFRGTFATRAECEMALTKMLDDAIRRGALLANVPGCFCDPEPVESDETAHLGRDGLR
jgi:hypothetical protein